MTDAVSRQPALFSDRFICPRCDAFAAQRWFEVMLSDNGGVSWTAGDDLLYGGDLVENVTDASEESRWRMSECASCGHRSVWRHETLIYPLQSPAPTPTEDMPLEVRPLYEEASAVAAVSKRAGAALARATLERLLKMLDPDAPRGARLDDYIARVMPRVNVSTGQLLTLIRHVGNKSLHVEDVADDAVVLLLSDDDAELLSVIFQTINDVIEELITRPNQTALLYEAVPATVRAAAEAKAARESQATHPVETEG